LKQSFDGVDLVKAAKVFKQLDFPKPFVEDVLEALLDAGLDDLATEVEAKLPPGCVRMWRCKWSKLGARALLSGAFRFLVKLLRPRGDRVVPEREIADETGARLRELGRDADAAAFEAEYKSVHISVGSGDPNEEGCGGHLLAMKLRELASPE
jgi:hypothetical protein